VERADGVAAAAHAGDDVIGQAARLVEHLLASLAADDGLKLAHQEREGMRTGGGAEAV